MAKSRIAEAYLQVVPSMGGFFQSLNTQLRPGLASTGSSAGSVIGSAMGGAISKAVDLAKVGAGLAAVGAGVAAGMVVKGGLSRALNIEDAQMKLTALKYSAGEVKSISASAMDAVMGTAYGFDSALKIAVTSLASGIPQGEGLTNYLKLVTDAAVISGASIEDMGYIFNKIQANGRAYAQELNMIADRGLPIFSWLAKDAGMSVADLRKEMRKGKITAEQFRHAVEANIGGSAKTAAETTRGYLLNTRTAISRFGATLIGGSLPIVMNALKDFIPVIDALNAKSKEGAASFWDRTASKISPAIDAWSKDATARLNAGGSLIPAFGNLTAAVKKVHDELYKMIVLVANSAQVTNIRIAAKITEEWFNKLKPISAIWKQDILPAFERVKTVAGEVYTKVSALWDAFAASPAGTMLLGAIELTKIWFENLRPISDIWENDMLPGLQAFWAVAGPIFEGMVNNWMLLFTTLAPILADAFAQLSPIVGQLIVTIATLVGMIASTVAPIINEIFATLIGGLGTTLPGIITLVGTVLGTVASSISTMMPSIAATFGAIFDIVKQIIDILVPIITALVPVISQIITTLLPVIMQIGSIIFQVLGQVLTAIGPSIVTLVGSIGVLVSTVMEALGPTLENLMPTIRGLIEILGVLIVTIAQILAAIISFVAAGLELLAPVITVIIGIIANVLKVILDVARSIISVLAMTFGAFASFLSDAWNNLVDKLNNIKIEIPDWFTELTGMTGTIGFNFQKLPSVQIPEPQFFATGGNIAPRAGGTLGVLGEAGRAETVTDLGQTNAFINATLGLVRKVSNGDTVNGADLQPVTIQVYPSAGMSEKELADKIYRIYKRNQRTVR